MENIFFFFFRGQKGILQHTMFDPRRVYDYIWFIVILIMGMGTLTLLDMVFGVCDYVWENAGDPHPK